MVINTAFSVVIFFLPKTWTASTLAASITPTMELINKFVFCFRFDTNQMITGFPF
jgi:hypothetical protein